MKKFVILLSFSFFFACASNSKKFISYNNDQLEYSGRIDSTQVKGASLHWSGNSVKINFKGTSISALLQDEKGSNYYDVIIDNNPPYILRMKNEKKYYLLASNLDYKRKHTVEIFKRTEWTEGKTDFFGFKIDGELSNKGAQKKRKIEFYGNSISAGYAVEDFTGKDRPDSIYTNNYLSYAAITARHFNAKYSCICRSGIGITISWFPLVMPEMYNRLNPTDPKSKWDFNKYTPDIVVINLMQNDSWLVKNKNHNQFKARFGTKEPSDEYIINAYQNFVGKIRSEYPKATIICALGAMDATKENSVWTNYIDKAVQNLNDSKIYTHFFPFKKTEGHPNIKEQQEMAKSLIQFIEENINW